MHLLVVVRQVLRSIGAQWTGDAAAKAAAVTEAGAGQRQGPMELSQNDVDPGEAPSQQILNQVVGLERYMGRSRHKKPPL